MSKSRTNNKLIETNTNNESEKVIEIKTKKAKSSIGRWKVC